MFNFKTYTAMALIGLLAACGGTSDGGGVPQTNFTYQALNNAVPVPGSSTIIAAGLTRSDTSGLPDSTDLVSGTYDRVSRELTIDGVVVDGVFQAASGDWTDGTTTLSPSDLAVFANTATYDFFVPVTVTKGDANQYIFGVASRTQDLPTDPGSQQTIFVFTGVAHVDGILGSDGTAPGTDIGSGGRLSLTADFARGSVDIVIDQLQDMPFNRVRIDNLDVSTGINATFERNGNGFITFEGGTGAPSLGASTTESASGAFFGGAINEIVAPSEAGGVFTVNGENGNTIYGIFAADERLKIP
jgi:hypothetical protein